MTSELHSIPVLASTRHLKIVVYCGKNRFLPSVMEVSYYKYFDLLLIILLKIIMEYLCYNYVTPQPCSYQPSPTGLDFPWASRNTIP